jgi:UDP-N-acetylglucosamine diphosphorylase / glucose-1-phosphate thymidylyltransferase / UDP-N-acetylgalactosamine diphosphorylase / glucosamine-1-phosphate N-acetyltransferase / galactosamine-1-phosphate N-acetyltransferase
MRHVIFDDPTAPRFYPIALTRSVGDLRAGILKLRQKLTLAFGIEEPQLVVPSRLQEVSRERHSGKSVNRTAPGDTLFLNSRLRLDAGLLKAIRSLKLNERLMAGDELLAARREARDGETDSETLCPEILEKGSRREHDGEHPLWNNLWEIIGANAANIEADYKDAFYDADNQFETEVGVTVLNPYSVWIGEGASLKPGVVIDATDGPVVIDEGAIVMPNAVIVGPAYIGKNSRVKIGAKIYEGTSIGPVCKIGGEVEETIVQGYSNKQHDGFLGHSWLGEWVNLGADTNNSDLKNTYGSVSAFSYAEGRKVDSGTRFLGATIADHVKIGINCSLNTGVVIGMGCNLYGPALIRDFVPSLRWGSGDALEPYRLEKFLETAKIVKSRRDLVLSEAEVRLLSGIAVLEAAFRKE